MSRVRYPGGALCVRLVFLNCDRSCVSERDDATQRAEARQRAEIGMGDGDDKRAEKRSNVPRNFPKKTKYKSKTFNF